jgi:hypothetical protein
MKFTTLTLLLACSVLVLVSAAPGFQNGENGLLAGPASTPDDSDSSSDLAPEYVGNDNGIMGPDGIICYTDSCDTPSRPPSPETDEAPDR